MTDDIVVALTGTPGTGKTTLSEWFAQEGWQVLNVRELAEAHGCLGEVEVNGAAPVDVHALAEQWQPPSGRVIVDGHLSHFLDIDAVVMLRCHPDALANRLTERGYSSEKVRANMEWEMTSGHWAELLEFEVEAPVLEVETTHAAPDALAVDIVAWLADGCPSPPLDERAIAAVDWLNEGTFQRDEAHKA
jgi:adenylate kinase